MRDKQPPFLPSEIADPKQRCGECGRMVRPDIWKRHDEPFGPVYPEGTQGEGGMWQRLTISSNCQCGSVLHFSINPKKLEHDVHFFGDEANRPEGRWLIECYSMVGGTSGTTSEMVKLFHAAKAKLLPEIEPSAWSVHTKNMFPPNERLRHPRFRQFSNDRIRTFFLECAAVMKSTQELNWNTAIFGFRKQAGTKKQRKKDAKDALSVMHMAILSAAIYRATGNGLRPKFLLDAQKEIKKLPHIEGWSRNTFLGSRHFLASELLTHGNEIEPPEFAPPGSRPELELADILSYFLARNLLHLQQGRVTEIPISKFGQIYYMIMMSGNDVDFFVGGEIPKKYIPSRV